jgi:MFS family permease
MSHAAAGRPPSTVRRADVQLLAFGFLLTFFSSFGQTFFIGLFSEELRAIVRLGDGAFGTVYSAATLASAVCVFWAGSLIDRVALRAYVATAAALLAVGCLLLTRADHVLLLLGALFLLRFAGQGLLTHTAVTTMARHFVAARGKALSAALLGHPAGEAVLPIAAVAIMAGAGWQRVWLLAAGLVLAAVPLLMWLPSAGAQPVVVHSPLRGTGDMLARNTSRPDATRREVIRDRRFYLLLPTVLLPSFVVTGVFIHQARLVAEQGWTLTWFAAAFMAFAAGQITGMLGAGPLIDRFSARRVVLLYLIPMAFACLAINLTDHRLVAFGFMAGAGLTTGTSAPTGTALWAELYGVMHLGAIRAMMASFLITSTALAPALFGWLLVGGVTFESILLACAAAAVVCALLARFALAAKPACRW